MNKNIYPLIFGLLALSFYVLSHKSFSGMNSALLLFIYSVLLLIGGVTTVKYLQYRKKVKTAAGHVAQLSITRVIGVVAVLVTIMFGAMLLFS